MLSLIYARSLNRCIGDLGQIPWDLPDEFAHFDNTTIGKPVIMGRKTYEDHKSALPGRLNIVVSTQADYRVADGVECVHTLRDAFELAKRANEEYFVIGGVYFFTAALPYADTVYETVIATRINGDTILPAFDFDDWDTVLIQDHPIDERHEFSFKVYRHKRAR